MANEEFQFETGEEDENENENNENNVLTYILLDDDLDLNNEDVWPERLVDTSESPSLGRRMMESIWYDTTIVTSPLEKTLNKIGEYLKNVFGTYHSFERHHPFTKWQKLMRNCVVHINNSIKLTPDPGPLIRLRSRQDVDQNSPLHIAKIILHDIYAIDAAMIREKAYGRSGKKKINAWLRKMTKLSYITGPDLMDEITKCLDYFNKNPKNKKMNETQGNDGDEGNDGHDNPGWPDYYRQEEPIDNEPAEAPKKNDTSGEKLLSLIVKATKSNRSDSIVAVANKLKDFKTNSTSLIKTGNKKDFVDLMKKYNECLQRANAKIKKIKSKVKKLKNGKN